MMKLPTYLAPSNLVIDPYSDEIYVVKSPRQDTADIARRLSRGTESTESKQFPWQREDGGTWRKAVIVNRNPTFGAVSKDRALSITERVSRPTKSSIIRQMDESGAESDTGGSQSGARSAFVQRNYYSNSGRPPVPSSSAQPERPILRTESSRRSRTSSGTTIGTNNNPRNVRFQSPLPMAASRLSSRSASSFDSFWNNNNSPSRSVSASSNASQSANSPSRATDVTSDGGQVNSKSSVSSESSKASSPSPASPVPIKPSSSSVKESGGRKTSPSLKPPSRSKQPPRSADSATSSSGARSGANSRQSKTSQSRDKENSSPTGSSNKNMELVLNFFSKLPPVV